MTNFHENFAPKSALKKWTFEGGQRCSIVKFENIALSIKFTHNDSRETEFRGKISPNASKISGA